MIVVGLSHKTAPIELRERLAVAPERMVHVLRRVCSVPHVREAVVLSTCNRVEIFAASSPPHDEDKDMVDGLVALLAEVGGREVVPHLDRAVGPAALLHLFRLATSLDSLVVGEPQILGQLKSAARVATEAHTLGQEIGSALRAALHVAKRVRTETTIGSGLVSVPSVAVDLARQIFHELRGKKTLLVGAGEMAETAARLLARTGAGVLVVNRNPERAAKLAATVGGTPHPWEQFDEALLEADIVISSTAARGHVITAKQLKRLRRRRRGRSLFLIDIAVPRDVEPAAHRIDNVYLYDIDDLSKVVAASIDERAAAAARAETMVREGLHAYEVKQHHEAMKPVIVALRAHTRDTLLAELDHSCRNKLKHLPDGDRLALTKMVDAAVNKLLHGPTMRLRELAGGRRGGEVAGVVKELFELQTAAPVDSMAPPSEEQAGQSPQRTDEAQRPPTDSDGDEQPSAAG